MRTTTPLAVGREVSRLTVRMPPPIAGTAHVAIVLMIDGVRQVCASGQVSPGHGDSYSLSVCPTYQLGPIGKAFMRANAPSVGITAEGKTFQYWEKVPTQWATWKARTVEAHVEVSGGLLTAEPELTFETGEAPRIITKNSVAFDAATSAQELSGDGVLSLSHTSTGADRAVYAGMMWSKDGADTGSVTYAGSGLTQINNVQAFPVGVDNNIRLAHYRAVGQTTGAQTVTGTVTVLNRQFLGVISMTGVDQTTPVGTAPTPTAGTASPGSITVASVGADDLVVDTMAHFDGTATIGADQTQRASQGNGGYVLKMSTQPGTAGGVMSWTYNIVSGWGMCAVAFKPVAAGGLAIPIVMHHRKMMES